MLNFTDHQECHLKPLLEILDSQQNGQSRTIEKMPCWQEVCSHWTSHVSCRYLQRCILVKSSCKTEMLQFSSLGALMKEPWRFLVCALQVNIWSIYVHFYVCLICLTWRHTQESVCVCVYKNAWHCMLMIRALLFSVPQLNIFLKSVPMAGRHLVPDAQAAAAQPIDFSSGSRATRSNLSNHSAYRRFQRDFISGKSFTNLLEASWWLRW